MVAAVAAIFLLAGSAFGNVYYRTNDILSLNPSANPMTVQKDALFRYTFFTRSSSEALDITGYSVTFEMIDTRDNRASTTGICTIVDATNGLVSISLTASAPPLEVNRQYLGVTKGYSDGVLAAIMSEDYITLVEAYCSTCGVSGGGGGSTTVVVTNNITSTSVVSVVITNIGGGGGGAGTISGINSATTGGVFFVVTNGWDAGISTNGNIFTIRTGLPQGATGVNQVATWNGTNWVAQALGAPSPTPFVGTNKILWATVWGVTNTWVAPSTQILFTAWGATGGAGAGGGGHARAIWVGSAGTIFDIVVGTAGNLGATNNGPFNGYGINATATATNHANGGGATYIAISGTTNIILIAGGSGGGGGNSASAFGGAGGGFYFGTMNGGLVGTNLSAGQGAWASNEYGLAATAGTNYAITGTIQNGSYLRGGNASTNGANVGITGVLGGGGGGWYGGAGATKTNAAAGGGSSGIGAGGGGGLSYADTNYVSFAQLIAGQNAAGGAPAAQDHPTYTAGRAIGGLANQAGSSGCAGAMW